MTEYICSVCNTGLAEIYNSMQDSGEHSIFSLPDHFKDLPDSEQKSLMERHEHLMTTLDKLHERKRNRIIKSVEDGKLVILLLCPTCRTVYDSRVEYTNASSPARKPDNKIISDDLDSIREATESDFDDYGTQDIYVYSDELKDKFYENKESLTSSSFFKKQKLISQSPLVKDAIRKIQDSPNKDIVDVDIY